MAAGDGGAVLPASCGVGTEVETVTAEDGETRGGNKLVMSVSFTSSPQDRHKVFMLHFKPAKLSLCFCFLDFLLRYFGDILLFCTQVQT